MWLQSGIAVADTSDEGLRYEIYKKNSYNSIAKKSNTKNEILPFATAWMDIKHIMFSEISEA